MQSKKLCYKSVLKYLFVLISAFLLTKTVRTDSFLGLPFYTAAMYLNFNPFITSAAFILSFAPAKIAQPDNRGDGRSRIGNAYFHRLQKAGRARQGRTYSLLRVFCGGFRAVC